MSTKTEQSVLTRLDASTSVSAPTSTLASVAQLPCGAGSGAAERVIKEEKLH